MRTPVFTGVCTALVTPFYESGGINFEAFASLIDYQISAGVSALCVCGTTGEAATLSANEQEALIRFCVKHTAGRVKVIAGTGSNSTSVAVERSYRAQELGADALLVVTPYYNKASQAGLVVHYEKITEAVSIPLILYNVPARTGVSFTAETYGILAQHPGINGVKEASGILSLVTKTRRTCPSDFNIWSGNDDQVVPLMSLGAKGVISVASNIIPEVMVDMCQRFGYNEYHSAAELQILYSELIDALFIEVNPIPVKTAMNLLGMSAGPLRLPLCSPSQDHLKTLRQIMEQLELL